MLYKSARVAFLLAAAMLVLAGCSEGSVEGEEPSGQLLVASGGGDSIATVDVVSGVREELSIDAHRVFNARWHPDGRSLLVEAIVDIKADEAQHGPLMYLANSDDLVLQEIEGGMGAEFSDPDWGPTCDEMVARRDGDAADSGGSSIWQVEVDGSGARKIAGPDGVLMEPDWSGDGSRLVFQRRIEGVSEIWVMARDEGEPTMVVGQVEGQGSSPRLSPDGERVLFLRSVEHDDGHTASQLFVLGLDDGELRQVTNNSDGAYDAVWSPDGEWIAFSDGYLWISIIRADGSDGRRIEAKGLPLDWGPVTGACGSAVA